MTYNSAKTFSIVLPRGGCSVLHQAVLKFVLLAKEKAHAYKI